MCCFVVCGVSPSFECLAFVSLDQGVKACVKAESFEMLDIAHRDIMNALNVFNGQESKKEYKMLALNSYRNCLSVSKVKKTKRIEDYFGSRLVPAFLQLGKTNQAKAIKEFFDGRKLTANGKDYRVGASAETGKVSVGGISNSGVNSQSDEDELSALGFEFYKILKYAPPKYRYAMTGVEVDECITMKELEEDPDSLQDAVHWTTALSKALSPPKVSGLVARFGGC